jgi:hypothetical protein
MAATAIHRLTYSLYTLLTFTHISLSINQNIGMGAVIVMVYGSWIYNYMSNQCHFSAG